jgi:hypothetical protein
MFYTLFNLETEPNLQHVGTVYQKVLAFQQFSLQIQIGSHLKPSSTLTCIPKLTKIRKQILKVVLIQLI